MPTSKKSNKTNSSNQQKLKRIKLNRENIARANLIPSLLKNHGLGQEDNVTTTLEIKGPINDNMPTSKKSNKTNSSNQQKLKRIKLIRANIARANVCENPLIEAIPSLLKNHGVGQEDNVTTTLEIKGPINGKQELTRTFPVCIQFDKHPLKEKRLESCLELFQTNMGEMYQKSSWGLNLIEKKAELMHSHARFLIVSKCKDSCDEVGSSIDHMNMERDDTERVLAFSHFRFDADDEDEPTQEVLYLYEIQIDSIAQRSGLGRQMMHIIERIAKQMKMRKVMLTVFKNNLNAMKFYESLSYSIDVTSPSQFGEVVDYEILSKTVNEEEEVEEDD
jgi:ribosomal protein S18 acetylase RimI-like enzyme